MTKQIIAISTLVLASTAIASAADLIYGMDFNSMGSSGIVFTNLGNGGTISSTSGYNNYADNSTLAGDSGYSHTSNGGTFNITNINNTALSTATGFAFTVNLYSLNSNGGWHDAFSFTIGGKYFKIEKTGSNGGIALYGADSSGASAPAYSNAISTSAFNCGDTWQHLGINVLTVNGNTTFSFYKGSTSVGSYTINGWDGGQLTALSGSAQAAFSAHTGNGIRIDNLGVYDSVLSISDFAYLASNPLVASIPEPSMFGILAGLGVLALAGARRRRK